jgi:hypothetical protein
MSDVHVVRDGDEWALEVDGQKRDGFRTQSEAITRGGQLASEEGGELVIHGQGGEIRQRTATGTTRATCRLKRVELDHVGPCVPALLRSFAGQVCRLRARAFEFRGPTRAEIDVGSPFPFPLGGRRARQRR